MINKFRFRQHLCILYFCLFFIFTGVSFCQLKSWDEETLSADFRREKLENENISISGGSIFWRNPGNIWIRMKKPIKQFIDINHSTMLVYYPGKNLCYQMKSQKAITLSFISPFIASLRSDYGLSDLKYQIKNFSINTDTLKTIWYPPQNTESKLGKIKIETVSQKIVQVSIFDPVSEELLQKICFNNFILINKIHWLPQAISIFEKDHLIEKIRLNNIAIDIVLPDSIVYFKPPENAVVKEFIW